MGSHSFRCSRCLEARLARAMTVRLRKTAKERKAAIVETALRIPMQTLNTASAGIWKKNIVAESVPV